MPAPGARTRKGHRRSVALAAAAAAFGLAIVALVVGSWSLARPPLPTAANRPATMAPTPRPAAAAEAARIEAAPAPSDTPPAAAGGNAAAARTFAVDGVVQDEHGAGVAGARVRLAKSYGGEAEPEPVAITDERGRFTLEGLTAWPMLWAEADGRVPSEGQWLRPAAGARVALTLVVGSSGAMLRGRIVDDRGAPLRPCAHVRLAYATPARRVASAVLAVGPADVRLAVDASGSFAGADLPAGSVQVVVVPEAKDAGAAEQWAPCARDVRLEPGAATDVEVRLSRAWSVLGEVRDAQGLPVAAVDVVARSAWYMARTTTDANGAFALHGLPPNEQVGLRCDAAARGKASQLVQGAPGERRQLLLELQGGLAIRGRAFDAAGAPLGGWTVQASTSIDASPVVATTATDGTFVLQPLEARPHLVRLSRAPDDPPRTLVRDVVPGAAELLLRLPAGDPPSASIRGRIQVEGDGDGACSVSLWCTQLGWSGHREAVDGAFEFTGLPAADYVLRAHAYGYPSVDTRIALSDGEAHDAGTIRLAAGSRLIVEVEGPAAGTSFWFIARGEKGATGGLVRDGHGEGLQPLPRGSYVLTTLDTTLAAFAEPFEVTGTDDTVVRVTVTPGTKCHFDVAAEALAGGELLPFRVQDEHGRTCWLVYVRNPPRPFTCALRPGRYVAILGSPDQPRARREFTVAEGVESRVAVGASGR